MTTHRLCTHAATSAARAICRRAGGPVTELPDASPVIARTASRRGRVEITDENHLEMTRAVSERYGIKWPTDEERAASLTMIWCGRCHLLHDSDAACVNAAARLSTRQVLDQAAAADRSGVNRHNTADLAARKNASANDASASLPTFTNARALASDIPEGRYAVREASGDVKFYKLDKPTQGKWAGYVFLKIMASDTEYPVKVAARQMSVFRAILDAGVTESSALYGKELGRCGVCDRTLTDAESIARGIGPVCAARLAGN